MRALIFSNLHFIYCDAWVELHFLYSGIELIIIIDSLNKGDVPASFYVANVLRLDAICDYTVQTTTAFSSIERILKFRTLIDRFIIIVTKSSAKHSTKKTFGEVHLVVLSMSSTMFRLSFNTLNECT